MTIAVSWKLTHMHTPTPTSTPTHSRAQTLLAWTHTPPRSKSGGETDVIEIIPQNMENDNGVVF